MIKSMTARAKVVVVSGGTAGMGRALALARAQRGDRVIAIGSDRIDFLRADLSSVAATPGFTRSGDASPLPAPLRLALRVAALAARPVSASVRPIVEWIDTPPTAVDRDRLVPLDTPTLDPSAAHRLADATAALLTDLEV